MCVVPFAICISFITAVVIIINENYMSSDSFTRHWHYTKMFLVTFAMNPAVAVII